MNLKSRKYLILILFVTVSIIYLAKLFYMQVIDDSWKVRAADISEKKKLTIPPRGNIVDRNGRLVVSNKPFYNLMVREADIVDLDTVALAKMLGWTPQQVRDKFHELKTGQGYDIDPETGKRTLSRYRKKRAYVFDKEISIDEMAKMAPYLYKFPGFYEELSSNRYYNYPNAANILGYVSEVSQREIDNDTSHYYKPGDNIGKAGIERYYEKELRGIKGVNYIVTSAANNELQPYANGKYDVQAKQGENLTLSLDIELQAYAEKLMKNKRGSVVAIEPSTGEILTMVSAPSYDPNLLVGKKAISENYPKLLADPDKPLFPRPVQAEYPPGSIFKLLQTLIALQERKITKNTGFHCNKALVGCHNHPDARNVMEAIKMSCNPYFYQAVRRVIQPGVKSNIFADAEYGLGKWATFMHRFGLGIKLPADLYGIRPGLIPDPNYYDNLFPSKSHPYGHNRWAFSTIRSISIGQGEVKVTPLQMANIAALIANRGWYITPHVVKSIGGKGPEDIFKIKHQTGIDEKYYEAVIEGMRRVVNEPGGTARRARMDDIVVCGKTGTAQNPHGEDHAVFICFAPKDHPKIAIAVFIENAGFGGTWSAPLAKLLLQKYLKGKVTDEAGEKRILEAQFLDKAEIQARLKAKENALKDEDESPKKTQPNA